MISPNPKSIVQRTINKKMMIVPKNYFRRSGYRGVFYHLLVGRRFQRKWRQFRSSSTKPSVCVIIARISLSVTMEKRTDKQGQNLVDMGMTR